jgi:hypothetical protein
MKSPIICFCDNQSAIQSVNSDVCSAKSRHIKVNFHYVREVVRDGIMAVKFVSTANMLADMMTKALQVPAFRLAVKRVFDQGAMGSVANSLLGSNYSDLK